MERGRPPTGRPKAGGLDAGALHGRAPCKRPGSIQLSMVQQEQEQEQEQIRVPGGEARAVAVPAGSRVSLVQTEGQQVGDLVAFNPRDLSEYLSVAHTRNLLWRLTIRLGDLLVTNRRRPLFAIVRDDVGTHDLLCVACDSVRYAMDYGVEGHANCLDNFRAALAQYDLPRDWVPEPINVFQNAPIAPDGSLRIEPSLARPGDTFTLRALDDALVAVSACPQDLAPTNNYRVKELLLVVERPATRARCSEGSPRASG